jgi:hypothetical protein
VVVGVAVTPLDAVGDDSVWALTQSLLSTVKDLVSGTGYGDQNVCERMKYAM